MCLYFSVHSRVSPLLLLFAFTLGRRHCPQLCARALLAYALHGRHSTTRNCPPAGKLSKMHDQTALSLASLLHLWLSASGFVMVSPSPSPSIGLRVSGTRRAFKTCMLIIEWHLSASGATKKRPPRLPGFPVVAHGAHSPWKCGQPRRSALGVRTFPAGSFYFKDVFLSERKPTGREGNVRDTGLCVR